MRIAAETVRAKPLELGRQRERSGIKRNFIIAVIVPGQRPPAGCVSVPPSILTRRTRPGGKCGGSVQVHVVEFPEVVGMIPANSFCARQ